MTIAHIWRYTGAPCPYQPVIQSLKIPGITGANSGTVSFQY